MTMRRKPLMLGDTGRPAPRPARPVAGRWTRPFQTFLNRGAPPATPRPAVTAGVKARIG